MNLNRTCLAILFAFGAAHVTAASLPVADFPASKPELIALLRANYVDYDKVAGKGEDLQAMIADSRGGLSVATPAAPERMFGTLLPNNVIYWRAGSFTPSTSWDEMTSEANGAKTAGLVLDLRSNTTPDDFNGALRVAAFLSKGQPGLVYHQTVATVRVGESKAILQGTPPLIVLTDRETRGAAEVLAAALQARGALVMGEATPGSAAIFREIPLGSGSVLRYASAHVYLSNGTDLWNRPVVPDVTTTVSGQDEASALALIDRQQVGAVISEDTTRHRMSEAALVRGQDPEQDSFIADHEAAAPAAQAPMARDLALLEALDSLKAIRVLQGEESSPQTRVADSLSPAAGNVIASTGMGR